jgi:hypothetical protein
VAVNGGAWPSSYSAAVFNFTADPGRLATGARKVATNCETKDRSGKPGRSGDRMPVGGSRLPAGIGDGANGLRNLPGDKKSTERIEFEQQFDPDGQAPLTPGIFGL